ncbi:MAG: S1C family serine protease [Streptosporangiaceae bacterium]
MADEYDRHEDARPGDQETPREEGAGPGGPGAPGAAGHEGPASDPVRDPYAPPSSAGQHGAPYSGRPPAGGHPEAPGPYPGQAGPYPRQGGQYSGQTPPPGPYGGQPPWGSGEPDPWARPSQGWGAPGGRDGLTNVFAQDQGASPWGSGPGGQTDTLGRPVRERRGPTTFMLVSLAVVIALVAGGIGAGIATWAAAGNGSSATTAQPVNLGPPPKGTTQRPAGSVASVAGNVLPSVVSVKVSGNGERGTGSGFVIKGGYIITNNHVAAPAAHGGRIKVAFTNGKTAPAQVVGRDESYDIAVLKPEGVSGSPPLPLGNSDDVVVGDSVIAIGSPLGLAGTVTSGIVSALNRPVNAGRNASAQSYISAIQTDAAINPGNSGGPLVDRDGEVVGVNSAIATLGGAFGQSGNIGVGFAIPINQARRVAQQIINTGHATHPIIGASIDVTYSGQGARIPARVPNGRPPPILPGGPADKAGLKPGDIIVKLDGKEVTSPTELIVDIRAHVPGDRVSLTYRRDGTEHTVHLALAASRSAG